MIIVQRCPEASFLLSLACVCPSCRHVRALGAHAGVEETQPKQVTFMVRKR